MLLVDDHDADIGQRRDDRQPCAHDDVDVAGPDPSPFVCPLAVTQTGVDQRHAGIEVGAQPVDEWHRHRDLGDQDQRRSARLERRRDRLDVDGRLAAAGDAIEEERARRTGFDGVCDPPDGLRLLGRQVRGGRPATPQTRAPRRERSSRSFPCLGLDQTTSGETGDRRRAMPAGDLGAGRTVGCSCQLRERGDLAWPERAAARPAAVGEDARGIATLRCGAQPAFVARPGGCPEQRPVERDQPRIREGAQPAEKPGATVRCGKVARGPGTGRELVEQVQVDRVVDRRHPVGGEWCPLGHELEPLEQARGQHRPDDERRRREIVGRDPAREGERQRREQRPVGADPIDDRLDVGTGRGTTLGRAEDDAEGLPPPELDQDRLAILQVREARRDDVGVRAVAAGPGGVDRDLDVPLAGVGVCARRHRAPRARARARGSRRSRRGPAGPRAPRVPRR